MPKTLRLILGDQLNANHSWFKIVDDQILYVLMEVRSETDYATHHIQKVVGFFAAMRSFAEHLRSIGHQVIYIRLKDPENRQTFSGNLTALLKQDSIDRFEYQLPDEYRLDQLLKEFCDMLGISSAVADTEHFYTSREELAEFFQGKKTYLMESFYRAMRKKHHVLMNGNDPLYGQWNFDEHNRQKLTRTHRAVTPLLFHNDLSEIHAEVLNAGITTMGAIDSRDFLWPINRDQALELLEFFLNECLSCFGSYQDAMMPGQWSLYHSRLSFAMNLKLISPREVIDAAVNHWNSHSEAFAFHQLEGFVRQIIGWREYMRGIYWMKMPEYEQLNFFNHQQKLPVWFWNAKTKMHCLRESIGQSLQFAYAHHIQRLMVTGNFALLAGVDPDEVDAWYLGIYIDAIQWVEITNTRGMSQFADGGIVGTKPYVSSAAYIDKMSHYCGSCFYKKNLKTGDRACPFNSLYWNFYNRHQALLGGNPRIGMMYSVWNKMKPEDRTAILQQADDYLKNIDTL